VEVEALCGIVRAAHPGLVESINWNLPNWSLGGTDLLTVNVPGREPVRIILHRVARKAGRKGAAPTVAGDPGGMLVWHSDTRASLAMPALETLDRVRAAIVAVVPA